MYDDDWTVNEEDEINNNNIRPIPKRTIQAQQTIFLKQEIQPHPTISAFAAVISALDGATPVDRIPPQNTKLIGPILSMIRIDSVPVSVRIATFLYEYYQLLSYFSLVEALPVSALVLIHVITHAPSPLTKIGAFIVLIFIELIYAKILFATVRFGTDILFR